MAHPATRHLEIIDVTVTDDFMERRTKAAISVANRWRKISAPTTALSTASTLITALTEAAGGRAIPVSLRSEVGAAINKAAPLHKVGDPKNDFEVAVVAAVAAIMAIDSGNRSEQCAVFAEALSAAMDMASMRGPSKLQDLWVDLAKAAATSDTGAEASRARVPVDPQDQAAAIAALAANARKDQEELDLLWWTVADWSEIGNNRLSQMGTQDATVAAALELTSILRWPAVAGLRHLSHRNISNHGSKFAMGTLADLSEHVRPRVDAVLAPLTDMIGQHPHVFVALRAVTGGQSEDPAAQQQKPAWWWTERLVREVSLAKTAGGTLGMAR
jgi:hypothetical protein